MFQGRLLFIFMSLLLGASSVTYSSTCSRTPADSTLIVYPAPEEVRDSMASPLYELHVRKPGGAWQEVFVYQVMVDLDNPQQSAMAYFDLEGAAELRVTVKTGSAKTASIRPTADSISFRLVNNELYFRLQGPSKLSIEFDGDIFCNLHLFANKIETAIPDPGDPDVIYFGPGLHQPGKDPLTPYPIPSGKTVYIAGGAVVRATFTCENAKNVRLIGRGIIDQSRYGLKIAHSDSVFVGGVILLNTVSYGIFGGQSNDLTVEDLKSISSAKYSDGIDLMSCNNVQVRDVFLRNSDDCIAIYGHRWDYFGPARNYSVSNAVLWADVAHPIHIGIHGNPGGTIDTISQLRFNDIDILEHDEDSKQFQGCMAISAGDQVFVSDVVFEDVRVEDFEEGQLINLRVVKSGAFNTVPGTGIKDILFKNITYWGDRASASVIQGYDSERLVRHVTFENVCISGKLVSKADSSTLIVGPFADNIRFQPLEK